MAVSTTTSCLRHFYKKALIEQIRVIELSADSRLFAKIFSPAMEPRLIPPAAESFTDKVDYTQGLIARQYLQNGAKYYFTLHLEYYMEMETHVPTGRWLAVILSPKGLRTFYLVKNEAGEYVTDNDEEEENFEQRTIVNEAGQLEPLINLNGSDVPFSEEMERQLDELNNMDAYLPLINEAIKEHKLS